ncbi:hypothetical protein C1X62_25340, partial [Pseudomonas sp. FW215-R3]
MTVPVGWPLQWAAGNSLDIAFDTEITTQLQAEVATCSSKNVYWLWQLAQSCRHRLSWCPITSVVSPARMPKMAAAAAAAAV